MIELATLVQRQARYRGGETAVVSGVQRPSSAQCRGRVSCAPCCAGPETMI